MLLAPVVKECLQSRQALAVLGPVCSLLARDDVGRMAHRKPFNIDPSLPGILEPFDAIRGEYEIEIEGAVLELDEVLAALDLRTLGAVPPLGSTVTVSDYRYVALHHHRGSPTL